MRDKRFIAEQRGGTLKKETHRQLIKWARLCAENVLKLCSGKTDKRLLNALKVAKEWEDGKATVSDARNASFKAIELANESSDVVVVCVARAVGHAVAAAHMADHSISAALYALKAVKNAGKSIEMERKWQNDNMPAELSDLILSSRIIKEKALKIY